MTQSQALAILKTGANVFLTGEPGSGKTHLVNQYVAYLRSNGIEPAITASTGIAATHIGGFTIHSWSGIGVKRVLTNHDLDLIVSNKRLATRIKNTDVLIIDEISMLASTTLDMVNAVCQAVRSAPGTTVNSLPFGGLQIVLVGDFFQLPPIGARTIQPEFQDLDPEHEDTTPFAFRSASWQRLDPVVCYLSEQHRQEDATFLSALSAIRHSEVTEDTHAYFSTRVVTQLPLGTVTKLFPYNANVDALNEIELAKLPGTTQTFAMQSRGAPPLIESLKRSCLSPEMLVLKIGAKVMFTKNSLDHSYVNGTTGHVIGFSKEDQSPIVKTATSRTIKVEQVEWAIQDGQKVLAGITQFPLRLAWAITVHKSQGMSLDSAVIDLRSAFEYGQGYVALSRVRALSGLYLLGLNARSLEVHPVVSEQDAYFRQSSALAGQKFAALNEAKLATLQTNFIKACGGTKGTGPAKPAKKISTYEVTKELLLQGLALEDIAKKRGMTKGTIISHVEQLLSEAKIDAKRDLSAVKPDHSRFLTIKKALLVVQHNEGTMLLSPTRQILGHSFSFDEIRLARLFV